MDATFRKHKGQWCVWVHGELPEAGAEVEVTKRNGKTTTVTVSEVLAEGTGWALYSIDSDEPRLTTRERKQRKAERLREWADGREEKAVAAYDKAGAISDTIPFGQPILVGHHSEKRHRRDLEKIRSNMDKAVEHHRKAGDHRQRADGIETQIDNTIYDDDPDAVDRLAEKIDELEAKRNRIKAYNASARKGSPDPSLLEPSERDDLAVIARVASYQLGAGGQFPSYVLSNLGANIRRYRGRLGRLTK